MAKSFSTWASAETLILISRETRSSAMNTPWICKVVSVFRHSALPVPQVLSTVFCWETPQFINSWKNDHHSYILARTHLLVHRSTQHSQMNRSRQILQCCWHTFLGSCRAVKYSCWWLQKQNADSISVVAIWSLNLCACTQFMPRYAIVGFLPFLQRPVDRTKKFKLASISASDSRRKVCQADWKLS